MPDEMQDEWINFFPGKTVDDFIAAYQASYGVVEEQSGTSSASATTAAASAASPQVGWGFLLQTKGISYIMMLVSMR